MLLQQYIVGILNMEFMCVCGGGGGGRMTYQDITCFTPSNTVALSEL